MNLWQWVAFEKNHLKTWLAKAQEAKLLIYSNDSLQFNNLKQVGTPLHASCLIFPLVLGQSQEAGIFQANTNSTFFIQNRFEVVNFTIRLQKDDESAENIMPSSTCSLKLLSVLGEFTICIAEIVVKLGWTFASFTQSENKDEFCLVTKTPTIHSVEDFYRVTILLRASLEILSYARGFKLRDFVVNYGDKKFVSVDADLWRKLITNE